jgi:hypothetical protein
MDIPTTWQAIYALNRNIIKNPDLIYPGQSLQMPGGGTYGVVQGDYLIKIAAGKGGGAYDPPINLQENAETAVTPVSTAPADENAANDDQEEPLRVEVTGYTDPGTPQDYVSAVASSRKANVLNEFASFTYHLTLYMVTASGYIAFLESGGTKVGEGFYVIAESGGTALNTVPARAFPDREFFIDDLSFKTYCNTKATQSPVGSIDFEFKITEPYGFSFTSLLKAKAAEITKASTIPYEDQNTNPMKQFYVLGVKFYGYQDDGSYKTLDIVAGQAEKQSGLNGIAPSYYPISIKDFSFRLDGRSTTYTIKAAPLSMQEAFGVKRGQIQSDFQVTGKTVGDVLIGNSESGDSGKPGIKGIIEVMNQKEKDLVAEGKAKVANVFKIQIDDDSILNAELTDTARYDKSKTAMLNIASSDDVSGKNTNNNFKFDPNTRTIAVSTGMSIVKFIDNTILTSSYITDALNTVYSEEAVTDSIPNATKGKELQWFMINPVAKPLGYDTIRKDYSYEITYYIAPYKLPYVKSVFVNPNAKSKYPGPFKRFEYYFTGKNTQVLNFELSYNRLYFLPGSSDTTQDSNSKTGAGDTPVTPGQKNSGMENQLGKAGIPVGSIKTSIYSPGDQQTAKLSILGDPDFLMTSLGVTKNATTPAEAAFGPNQGINPLGGQIFIEINFYEGVDYDDRTGLLKINDNIEFFNYDKSVKDAIEGIVYMVNSVESTFSKGKFTQDLKLILWNESNSDTSASATAGGRENATNNQGFPLATDQVGATNTTGFNASPTPNTQDTSPQPNLGQQQVSNTNQSVLNAIQPVGQTAGKQFVSNTNQSVITSITQVNGQDIVATTQTTQNTVVDDDSITTQPALSYAGNHLAGRET